MQAASWQNDVGGVVFSSSSTIEVSLPNILGIFYLPFAPVPVVVTLFNSFKSLWQINFGNPINVAVSYLSGNIPGAPALNYDYVNLLNNLLVNPMEVGVTRIVSSTRNQSNEPLHWLRNVGAGKYAGKSFFPLTYPNQYQETITYVQDEYVIDGFTQLKYTQSHLSQFVTMYFYSERTIDTSRAFANEKVVQKYAKPQISFESDFSIENKN